MKYIDLPNIKKAVQKKRVCFTLHGHGTTQEAAENEARRLTRELKELCTAAPRRPHGYP